MQDKRWIYTQDFETNDLDMMELHNSYFGDDMEIDYAEQKIPWYRKLVYVEVEDIMEEEEKEVR
jgi:hypothetical protein